MGSKPSLKGSFGLLVLDIPFEKQMTFVRSLRQTFVPYDIGVGS